MLTLFNTFNMLVNIGNVGEKAYNMQHFSKLLHTVLVAGYSVLGITLYSQGF